VLPSARATDLNAHTHPPEACLAVNPAFISGNPTDDIPRVRIMINITGVADLYTYGFYLGWKTGLLLCTGVREITEFFDGDFYYTIEHNRVYIASTLLGPVPGVTGSGRLASITLDITDTGNTTLSLYETELYNSTGQLIAHSVLNGAFCTTLPVASFTYSPWGLPERPLVDEPVTFNATKSYDPDDYYEDPTPGGIVSYEWDFGDGTTGSGMITTHQYSVEGKYTVALQITDDDGVSDQATATIDVWGPLLAYISVPYHRQITGYYCGPAALEMVFDFYGPDVHQSEIADVARTAPDGTYTCDMVRATHFSGLSTSVGEEMPGSITGYSARKLGFAALECWDMTIDQLKSLIDARYPVVVLTTWHFRVAVGYSGARIMFQDSYHGTNTSLTYGEFDTDWDYSSHWGLFVSPWEIEIFLPDNISQGSIFNVTASITYPCPPPFPTYQYPASMSNATVNLPAGLRLVSGEQPKKVIDTGVLVAGASVNVTWTVQADTVGAHTIFVEAEGKVEGFVPPLPSYPEFYEYEDRIGGFTEVVLDVVSSEPSPHDATQELVETIESWDLLKGIKKSLTSQLKCVLRVLEIGEEDRAVRMLVIFERRAENLRGKHLTEEQTDCLTVEAQRIIELIQGPPTTPPW